MKKALTAAALLFLPLISSAQSLNLSPLQTLISSIASLIGMIVPVLLTLALVVFFWGLVRYLWGHGGKADIDGAKRIMKWGLITLFVMVSVWGIIELMQTALGINKNATGKAPQILYSGANSQYPISPSFQGVGANPY
jgi:hypothetical protein